MKNMKKAMAVVLAAAMVASMAACGSSSSSTSSASGASSASAATTADGYQAEKVVIETSAGPTSLSPYAGAGNANYRINYACIYQQLFRQYGYGVKLEDRVGVLAESFEYDEATLTYTIHIKKGIHDSAGNPFTADDVIFSFQKHNELQSDSATQWAHADINSLKAVDDYTVSLTMKDNSPGIINTLFLRVNMITREAFEAAGENGEGFLTNPVGTGPYKLVTANEGTNYVLEAVEDYWNAGSGEQNVKQIEFVVITESAQRGINFEAGDVDALYDVSASDYSRLQSNDDAQVRMETNNQIVTLGFNCSSSSICSDVNVRQAIAYAIDVDAVTQTAYNGLAAPCYVFGSSIWADWQSKYDSQKDYVQDTAKATSMLQAAGASGKTLKFAIDESQTNLMIATIIQEELKQVGITVEITQYDSATYNTIYKDKTAYDMYIQGARTDTYATHIINNYLNMNNSGGTRVGLEDDKLQSLITPYTAGHMTNDQFAELFDYYETIIPYYAICMTQAPLVVAKGIDMDSVKVACGFILYPGSWTYTSDFTSK